VTSNDVLSLGHLSRGESDDNGRRDLGLDPDLGFTAGMRHVHVHPRFFAREEEQAVRTFTEDGRGHVAI